MSSATSSLCYSSPISDDEDASLVSHTKSTATEKRVDPPKSIDVLNRLSTASSSSRSVLSLVDKENDLSSPNTVSTTVTAVAITKNKKKKKSAAAPPKKIAVSRPVMKRRDLVKRTQRNINNATVSVNQTLNAARIARKVNLQQRQQEIAAVRNQWREEKQEANQYHNEAANMRHGLLNLQKQLSSKYQQVRVQAEVSQKHAHLNAITRESHFQSEVYRDQQRALKEQRDRKRRESTQARAKLRQNHRAGEEKLRMMRLEEDRAVSDERHACHVAIQKTAKENAERRRKSFAFRNGDASRIRATFDRMKAEEQQKEHESIQLKLGGARDAVAYQKKMEEDRRKSLAFRNNEGSKQRAAKKDRECEEMAQEHASFEIKWQGEQDADAYKHRMEVDRRKSLAQRNKKAKEQRDWMEEQRMTALSEEQTSIGLTLDGARDAEIYREKMDEQRRQSLAQRNAYAKKQRDLQAEMDMKAHNDEHDGFELKWGGEQDADAYKQQLAKERRESLKFRNKEHARHAKVMDELRNIAQEKETESYLLKWAGEEDAKVYLAKVEEDRRQSLNFRNQEGKLHRQIKEEQRMKAVDQMHEDELLRAAGRKDMEAYKEKCAQRDRTSLEFRRKEANVQRMEEKRKQQEEFEVEQSNHALEDEAHWDVAEYIRDCKDRRRLSLAFRAKEKRGHRRWEQKAAHNDLERRMQDMRLRSLDKRQEEIARREERKRIAMDAIRHAGCSFNVNAFSALRVDF